MQRDGPAAAATFRCHSPPSDHSLTSKNDAHITERQQQRLCNESVSADCPTRNVQIAMKRVGYNAIREQHQQSSDSLLSASQESIISCTPVHQKKTHMPREPLPTLSMSTLATDVGRFVTRPVPVAPSGPAGHRRGSKIPRPKLTQASPSMSITSTTSKCSSITSLRSEFNYARPMPIERVPFSKSGLEYIMPLARQEVFVIATDAFSITGTCGQRKRFLPLVDSIAEDLWQKVRNTVDPLLVVTAQYDAGLQDACSVSITASIVARTVSHVATQTRKSAALTSSTRQRKKTCFAQKENAEKNSGIHCDYSGMLVRLVQLLYLQTKLNKAEKNNSANTDIETANCLRTSQPLLDYMQNQQQELHAAHLKTADVRRAQINLRQRPSHQDGKVYRMGSSVTQVFSNNYPSLPVSPAKTKPANNWENAVESRTVHFDQALSDKKPSSYNYHNPATKAFSPNYNQRHNYDKSLANITTYHGSSNVRYTY